MTCNVCQGTGIVNLEQVPSDIGEQDCHVVLEWIKANPGTDAAVCHCCGDGEQWYGEPGQHYGADDPMGKNGPYAYNGGLCLCH